MPYNWTFSLNKKLENILDIVHYDNFGDNEYFLKFSVP